MDCCPICGSDIEIVPYFDIREPLRTGYEIIHLKQNNCSVRS